MSKYDFSNLTGESEVFQEFIRIYGSDDEKTGQATPSNDPTKAKKESEDLYGLETKTNESNKPIQEQAYLDKAEVATSYHTNGGVVETPARAQEIDIGIAERNPNGRISNKAIASKDLIDELIVVAEEMDIRGHHDIAIFADKTAEKVVKKATPLAIAGIVAGVLIPTLVGAYYGIAHMSDPINMNIQQNIDSLQLAIAEYKKEKSQLIMNSTLSDQLDNLVALLTKFDAYRTKFLQYSASLANHIPKPKGKGDIKNLTIETAKSLQSATSDSDSVKTAKIIKALNDMNENYAAYSRKIIAELSSRKNGLAAQFKSMEGLSNDESPGRSNWEKFKNVWNNMIGGTQQGSEKQILESITDVIKFINTDITARTAEKAEIVRQVSTSNTLDEEFVAPKIEGIDENLLASSATPPPATNG